MKKTPRPPFATLLVFVLFASASGALAEQGDALARHAAEFLSELNPAIDPSLFGHGSSRERLLIASRHEGCSVFDIGVWPLFVHVAKRTGSTDRFEVSSWGELYPTLHSAIEQPIPCREGRRNLPWSLVSSNIPCTWETLWYGFSHGFVELSVLERFRDERMAAADEKGSIALVPLYEADSPAEFVRCFEQIASSSGSGIGEDGRLRRLWESVSDSGNPPDSSRPKR